MPRLNTYILIEIVLYLDVSFIIHLNANDRYIMLHL